MWARHFYIVLVGKWFNFSRRQFCNLSRDHLWHCNVPFGKYNDAVIKMYVYFNCKDDYKNAYNIEKRETACFQKDGILE